MIFLLRDKQLIRTVSHPIFRFETGVDNLIFIVPEEYEGCDLSKCIPVVEVSIPCDDEGNTQFFYTNWTFDTTPYKEGYLSLTIPVNSQLTQYSGHADIWIMFVQIGGDSSVAPSVNDGTTDGEVLNNIVSDENNLTEGDTTYNYAKVVLKSFRSCFEISDSGSSDSATEKDFEEVWKHVTIDGLADTVKDNVNIIIDSDDDDDPTSEGSSSSSGSSSSDTSGGSSSGTSGGSTGTSDGTSGGESTGTDSDGGGSEESTGTNSGGSSSTDSGGTTDGGDSSSSGSTGDDGGSTSSGTGDDGSSTDTGTGSGGTDTSGSGGSSSSGGSTEGGSSSGDDGDVNIIEDEDD